jgi:ATP/ADP translocase/HEAT repeat protein
MKRIKNIVNIFYDIRQKEWKVAGLMFLLHFLMMTALYLLKPARDSLFLSGIGSRQLPFVYLLLAAVSIPVSVFISKITQKYSPKPVLQYTLIFFIVNIGILRLLFNFDAAWLYYVFYILIGIFSILLISQFWLFANTLFRVAQSKRLFAFLNLGSILGAIAGSGASIFWGSTLSLRTENLLLASIIPLSISWLIIHFIKLDHATQRQKPAQSAYSSRDLFKTVRSSRYQLLLAGTIGLAVLVSTLVDYQFKTIAAGAYPDTVALTSFMGRFYAGITMASLLIQVFLSTSIIKRLGLKGAVLTRPAGMTVGTLLFLIAPVLASLIFLQGFDRATRYSIDKTGRELLFLPVGQQVKEKTKVFIDLFANRFFRGVAGLLLLFMVFYLDFSVQQISYMVLGVIGFWMLLGTLAHKKYIRKFRISLQKRYLNSGNIAINLDDPTTFRLLKSMLESEDSSRIAYGLGLLKGITIIKLKEELRELLGHPNSKIRLSTLKLLKEAGLKLPFEEVKFLLDDVEPEIRFEVGHYLRKYSKKEHRRTLQHYLIQEKDQLKKEVMGYGMPYIQNSVPTIDDAFMDKVMKRKGKDSIIIRAQVATILGQKSHHPKRVEYLTSLLRSNEPLIVRKTLDSIEQLKDQPFLPALLNKLKDSDHGKAVQQVFAAYREDAYDYLKKAFFNPSVEREVQKKIPGVFLSVSDRSSVEHLIDLLEHPDPVMRYHVIKVLNKLKNKYQKLLADHAKIRAVLKEEARQYFELLAIKSYQRTDIPNNILVTALTEKMDQSVERLFRLAGLIHDQQDLYGSYLALRSGDKKSQDISIEFMDNILKQGVKEFLWPVIDMKEEEERLKKGRQLFNLPLSNFEDSMKRLLRGDDIWLKVCAIFSVSKDCPESLKQMVHQYTSSYAPSIVKETAEYVINRHQRNNHEYHNRKSYSPATH